MGIAIKLTDSDFSENNLGRVTFLSGPIQGLSISGSASIAGNETSAQYSVAYNPANTEEDGVTWSVVSGDNIASIDENGLLTIATNRAATQVVIRATSVYKPSLYAEKTISIAEHTSFYSENNIEVVHGYYGTSGVWKRTYEEGTTTQTQYYSNYYSWNPLTTVADGNYKITAEAGYKFRVVYSADGGTTKTRTDWFYGEHLLSEWLPSGGLFAIVMGKGTSTNTSLLDLDIPLDEAEDYFKIERVDAQ